MASTPIVNIGKKIKELRLLNSFTQEELAQKANVSYASLTKIESGVIKKPSLQVVEKIAKALEVQIENITSQSSIVKIFNNKDCISKLLDNVYLTLKGTKGEVYISGIDERKFLATDADKITSHISRLTKAKIHERLLAREGDTKFFAGPQSEYRWVPDSLFNPTPIYVYGNKLAMIVWGPPQQVVIIENYELADAYRKQFLFIWERSKVPPTKKIVEDEKNRLQLTLCSRFGGRISSLKNNDNKLFRDFIAKEKYRTYGNSYYYMCQAANGVGKENLGLKYFDGEMLASIGVFNRSSLGGGWHFHIVHPIGIFDENKILSVARTMMELSGRSVFVKKISKEQQKKLINVGFSSIENYSWHAQALEEDDTFPEQIINIKYVLSEINENTKGDLNDKYRRFISKYRNCIKNVNVENSKAEDVKHVINNFFEYLGNKELSFSQPSDYYNFISSPPIGSNGRTYFSQLIYIENKPAGFFAAEKISDDTVGLYANIALHNDFPYLSEYLIVYICEMLDKKGFKYLNLGGSETAGLFQFKDKFSPVEYNKMHWAVYKI